jgi:hypothetical protein
VGGKFLCTLRRKILSGTDGKFNDNNKKNYNSIKIDLSSLKLNEMKDDFLNEIFNIFRKNVKSKYGILQWKTWKFEGLRFAPFIRPLINAAEYRGNKKEAQPRLPPLKPDCK